MSSDALRMDHCPIVQQLVCDTLRTMCEINIKFNIKLDILGSVHIRADGEDVLNILLHESSTNSRLKDLPSSKSVEQPPAMGKVPGGKRVPNPVKPPDLVKPVDQSLIGARGPAYKAMPISGKPLIPDPVRSKGVEYPPRVAPVADDKKPVKTARPPSDGAAPDPVNRNIVVKSEPMESEPNMPNVGIPTGPATSHITRGLTALWQKSDNVNTLVRNVLSQSLLNSAINSSAAGSPRKRPASEAWQNSEAINALLKGESPDSAPSQALLNALNQWGAPGAPGAPGPPGPNRKRSCNEVGQMPDNVRTSSNAGLQPLQEDVQVKREHVGDEPGQVYPSTSSAMAAAGSNRKMASGEMRQKSDNVHMPVRSEPSRAIPSTSTSVGTPGSNRNREMGETWQKSDGVKTPSNAGLPPRPEDKSIKQEPVDSSPVPHFPNSTTAGSATGPPNRGRGGVWPKSDNMKAPGNAGFQPHVEDARGKQPEAGPSSKMPPPGVDDGEEYDDFDYEDYENYDDEEEDEWVSTDEEGGGDWNDSKLKAIFANQSFNMDGGARGTNSDTLTPAEYMRAHAAGAKAREIDPAARSPSGASHKQQIDTPSRPPLTNIPPGEVKMEPNSDDECSSSSDAPAVPYKAAKIEPPAIMAITQVRPGSGPWQGNLPPARAMAPDSSQHPDMRAALGQQPRPKQFVSNQTESFQCPQCPVRFPTLEAVQIHIGRSHVGAKVTGNVTVAGVRSDFLCRLCGSVLKTKDSFENHMNTVHNRSRTFKCPMCSRSFFSRQSLCAHKRKHELEEDEF